jgi:hypothetical protein
VIRITAMVIVIIMGQLQSAQRMMEALVETVVFVSLHFLDRLSDLFDGLIESLAIGTD